VWNDKDDALYSKTWTIDINTWAFWKKALGKYGDTTEGAMSHFTGKVTFHNFSPLYIEKWLPFDVAHNYQWQEAVVNLYKGYKFGKGEVLPGPTTKMKNNETNTCEEGSECLSGFCDVICKYGPPMSGGGWDPHCTY
jgi:hypothetical protein